MKRVWAAGIAALVALSLLSSSGVASAPRRSASYRVDFAGKNSIRGNLGKASGSPRRAARAALLRWAGRLRIDPATFRFESVRRSLVGIHVRGRQYRDNIAIEGSAVAVHIVRGRVWQIDAVGTHLKGRRSKDPESKKSAVKTALVRVGVAAPEVPVDVERVMVRRGHRLVDAYRIVVFSLTPAVAATVEVAAADGSVLAVRDDRLFADGSATVFDPNPIVSTKDNTLRTPGVDSNGVDTDLDSAELTAALVTLPIRDVDPTALLSGRLVGPWVEVQGPAPLGTTPTFNFTRGDPRFETTMAYAHLDRLQRYIQSLGFTGPAGVNAEPQNVYTLPVVGYDNSFYQGGSDIMVLGAGGVDDGEDAEVIVHEYGHAIQGAQVPGWSGSGETGAMGEGFGDFLAGAYYARTISDGFQDACIADWDSTSYSDDDPPCLRRLDGAKHYPVDKANEVHDDGEMWSAFLWRLRDSLGCGVEDPSPECAGGATDSEVKSDRVITLVLAAHEFLTGSARFGHGVAALRTAAAALGHPEWIDLVDRAAAPGGMPLNP